MSGTRGPCQLSSAVGRLRSASLQERGQLRGGPHDDSVVDDLLAHRDAAGRVVPGAQDVAAALAVVVAGDDHLDRPIAAVRKPASGSTVLVAQHTVSGMERARVAPTRWVVAAGTDMGGSAGRVAGQYSRNGPAARRLPHVRPQAAATAGGWISDRTDQRPRRRAKRPRACWRLRGSAAMRRPCSVRRLPCGPARKARMRCRSAIRPYYPSCARSHRVGIEQREGSLTGGTFAAPLPAGNNCPNRASVAPNHIGGGMLVATSAQGRRASERPTAARPHRQEVEEVR